MTSISFFILLLVAYSYSVPVEKVRDSSTVNYEFTTDTIMVDRENTSSVPLIPGEQSTGIPNIHKKRGNPVNIPPRQGIDESSRIQNIQPCCESSVQERSVDYEESLTTQEVDRRREQPILEQSTNDYESLSTQEVDRRREPSMQERSMNDEESSSVQQVDRRRESSSQERSIDEHDSDEVTTTDISRPIRTYEESSLPSITIRSAVDYASSHEENDKRNFQDEFSTTTIESSTQFNRRAIGPVTTETYNKTQDEIQLFTRGLPENNIQTTTNVISSSVDSFGKITGLLHDPSNGVSITTQSSFTNQPSQK